MLTINSKTISTQKGIQEISDMSKHKPEQCIGLRVLNSKYSIAVLRPSFHGYDERNN
jgi:hypothetical protein